MAQKIAIAQAENNNLIAPEQYNSWKAKVAIAQCINKCLWYNYVHF